MAKFNVDDLVNELVRTNKAGQKYEVTIKIREVLGKIIAISRPQCYTHFDEQLFVTMSEKMR